MNLDFRFKVKIRIQFDSVNRIKFGNRLAR